MQAILDFFWNWKSKRLVQFEVQHGLSRFVS